MLAAGLLVMDFPVSQVYQLSENAQLWYTAQMIAVHTKGGEYGSCSGGKKKDSVVS